MPRRPRQAAQAAAGRPVRLTAIVDGETYGRVCWMASQRRLDHGTLLGEMIAAATKHIVVSERGRDDGGGSHTTGQV
jgi:hypothetical protein